MFLPFHSNNNVKRNNETQTARYGGALIGQMAYRLFELSKPGKARKDLPQISQITRIKAAYIRAIYANIDHAHHIVDVGTKAPNQSNFKRRKVWALRATMMVLSDINKAPTAGGMIKPSGARIPAARGIMTIL